MERLKAAVTNLYSSDYKSWPIQIKRVSRILEGPDIAAATQAIESSADASQWIEQVHASQGGMVGSAELIWPDETHRAAGLWVALIKHFAKDSDAAFGVAHVLFANTRYDDDVRDLTGQVLLPGYDDFITFIDDRDLVEEVVEAPRPTPTKKVFVVHGRDNGKKSEVARFLEKLGLEVIILHERPNKGRALISKFEQESADVTFAVVIINGDDTGGLSGGEHRPRARQNVVFELGFFIGRLGSDRVCALVEEGVEKPSDYDGVGYVKHDASGGWKGELAKELFAAGVPVDFSGVIA